MYIACLKSKRGELRALQHLPNEARRRTIPLFDVTPGSCADDGAPRTTVEQNLNDFVRRIDESWLNAPGTELMVDFQDIGLDATTARGQPAVIYFCEQLRKRKPLVAPFLAVSPGRPAAYLGAVAKCLEARPCKLAVRLDAMSIAPSSAHQEVRALLDCLGAQEQDCVLLLDFRFFAHRSTGDVARRAEALLGVLQGKWRGVSTLGSGMPAHLAHHPVGQTAIIERSEQYLFRRLRSKFEQLWFGDYAVVNPFFRVPSGRPQSTAKIRHAVDRGWVFIRGGICHLNPRQYVQLATSVLGRLREEAGFRGAGFSWGAAYLAACAEGQEVGNPETWIAVDTNHHVHQVLHENAEAFGYSPESLLPYRAPIQLSL